MALVAFSLTLELERGGLGRCRGRALNPADSYRSGKAFRNLDRLKNASPMVKLDRYTCREDPFLDGGSVEGRDRSESWTMLLRAAQVSVDDIWYWAIKLLDRLHDIPKSTKAQYIQY